MHAGQGNLGGQGKGVDPSMKDPWYRVSLSFVANALLVSFLSAGLVVLQHFCMTHNDGDFVDSYCLTDTKLRTVIAAILTIMGVALTAAVSSAVEAYRTMRLANGINEGVYIAMGSQNIHYQLRAMSTKWAPVMLVIILAFKAPLSIQTLANLGIKTVGVYVRNPSTAQVFNAYSNYSADVQDPIQYPLNYVPFKLVNAVSMLAKMRDFRNNGNVTLAEDNRGSITTVVIRDGYVLSGVTRNNDATNAFTRLETVVTVETNCSGSLYSNLSALSVPPVIAHNRVVGNVTFSDTFAEEFAGGFKSSVYHDHDVLHPGSSLVDIYMGSQIGSILCLPSTCGYLSILLPDSVVSANVTTCTSRLRIQDQIVIYTVGAETVTPVEVVSNTTTVNITLFANLIAEYANSVESIPSQLDDPDNVVGYAQAVYFLYQAFPSGNFDNTTSGNIAHSKICAAVALVLNLLWTSYGPGETDRSVAAGVGGTTGNAFVTYTEPLPLYNIVQLTHISTTVVVIIAGVLAGCAWVVSLLGMVFAIRSRINIKPATDSSLLHTIPMDATSPHSKQALGWRPSNDPAKQRELEFRPESMLYCRDVTITYQNPYNPAMLDEYHRINVSSNTGGEVPIKSQTYW